MNKKEIISILTVNQRVAGSSPAGRATKSKVSNYKDLKPFFILIHNYGNKINTKHINK